LPTIPPSSARTADEMRDSLRDAGLDSAAVRAEMRSWRARQDTVAQERRAQECSTGETFTVYRCRYDGTLPIALAIPSDSTRLSPASELPASIYDAGEELFGVRERDELVKALTMGLQPGWSPQKPTVEYGLAFTRFNRVEGFSTGAEFKQTLGSGYTAT